MTLYRAAGKIFNRAGLKAYLEAEAAELPSETWRDGKFEFEDYLIESLQTGTIEKLT